MGIGARILLQLLFILQATCSLAQHHTFRSYTMTDGLTNNAIRKIYQDMQGFIWICTWEGLNKFEGHKFTGFNNSNGLPHSVVNDLLEISPGVIMVAMNDGTISYIRNGQLDPRARQKKYVINHLLQDPKKRLLGATDSYGLVKIDSNEIVRTSGNDNFSLYEFIKWRDNFISIGDPAQVIVYDQHLKMISKSSNKSPFQNCIYKDRNEQIILGTDSGLRYVDMSDPLNPSLKKFTAIFDHPVLQNGAITAIYQDHTGNFWFGTYTGLVKVTPAGVTRFFTERDGLPGNRITCITGDTEKNLWIGTYSGLAKLPFQSVDVVAPSNGLHYKGQLRAVSSLNQTQLALIAGDALYKYDSEKDKMMPLLPWVQGSSAVPIDGSDPYSLIHNGKVYSWDERSSRMEPIRSFKSLYYYFAAAQYQKMICAATMGLTLQFEDGKILHILDSIRMHTSIWDHQGRIIAGSWDGGLYRVTIDPIIKKVKVIENLSSIPPIKFVRSLQKDKKGNIWVGTRYHGVLVLTETEKGTFNIRYINLATGLLSNWVQNITEAPDGNMWIGSLSGVSKIITTDASFRVFNFSKVIDFYSSVTGMIITGNNQFWGVSDRGLFSYRDLQLENTKPLPIYFTNIRLGNTDSNYVAGETGKIPRLRYNENYLRFEFSSPGFINEKDLNYSYRLQGSVDTSWSTPSNQHSVEYASLNAGQYVFEVKMKGWNGTDSRAIQFPFVINRPFWQSVWFYLSAALLLILVALSIIRYRTKQLLKLQRVRNAIATDLHDDIGASLTNISILSQLSLSSIDKKEDTKKFISRIRDEVESSNQALDDIIWSVNSRNDSMNETLARMRRYVGDLFDNSSTKYHIDIINDDPDQKFNMEQRRDLFMIYKETLNNIHKHAGAENAWITIKVLQQVISVSITDDGRGFDSSIETHRNGLKNIRSRVNKWKGDFHLETSPSTGTRIGIKLPVAAA